MNIEELNRYWAEHPAELEAARAEGQAVDELSALFDQLVANELLLIRTLKNTETGAAVLTSIGVVIAAEQLRCQAAGCSSPPTWEQVLERYGVLSGATIAEFKSRLQRETSN